MNVIPPITMTEAQLVSSNVPEDEYPEWDSGTSYSAGTIVQMTTDEIHRIYSSALSSNLNNPPATRDPTTGEITEDTINWVQVSWTNRWRAFDQVIADQVTQDGDIEFVFSPATRVTGLALFGLDAESVRIVVNNGATDTYDQTFSLVDTSNIYNIFEYFAWNGEYDRGRVITGLPGFVGTTMTVTVSSTGTTKVGQICLGNAIRLGATVDNSEVGIDDFSIKEFDERGKLIVVPRRYSDLIDGAFAMPSTDVRRVKNILTEVRTIPAVYFADEDKPEFALLAYGIFKSFSIPVVGNGEVTVSLEIQSLT